jgi:hypothetical protein
MVCELYCSRGNRGVLTYLLMPDCKRPPIGSVALPPAMPPKLPRGLGGPGAFLTVARPVPLVAVVPRT